MHEEASSGANQVVDSSEGKTLVSNQTNQGKDMALGRFSSLHDLLNYYEGKMMDYIYEIPHIPPTTFELKVRHTAVKKEVIQLYHSNTVTASSSQQIADQIDQLFNLIVERNAHEHKMCQTGFVIGWKNQSANEAKSRNNIHDRF